MRYAFGPVFLRRDAGDVPSRVSASSVDSLAILVLPVLFTSFYSQETLIL